MKLCPLVFASTILLAQNAQVSGLVRDSSGAIVRDATLTFSHEQTGVRRATESNRRGIYAVTSLRPGQYKIMVRKPGFQTLVRLEVHLETAQRLRVDFVLRVGDVEQVVTVFGDSIATPSSDASVGALVPGKLVRNLPLNGRGLMSILEVGPGVVTTPVRFHDAGQFSVNGQRSSANSITVDGLSSNFGVAEAGSPTPASIGTLPAYSAVGSLHPVIAIEALDEFRVVTSTAPAEFGRFSGAHVVLRSRSGTNQWHGSAFFSARNEKLAANDWLANASGAERQPLHWRDFGGSLGGPILRERTFFLAAQDSFAMKQFTPEFALVPTPQDRATTPAAVRSLLDLFQSSPTGVFESTSPLRSRLNGTHVRADHHFGSSVSAFARFQRTGSATAKESAALPRTSTDIFAVTQLAAGLNWTASPHLHQETRVQVGRASSEWSQTPVDPIRQQLAAFIPAITGPRSSIALGLLGTPFSMAASPGGASAQTQWQLVHSASLVSGRHLWKAGFDVRRVTMSRPASETVTASFTGFDTMAAGSAYLLSRGSFAPLDVHLDNVSVFLQDNWSVSQRVSLEFGLRWERNPPPGGDSPLFALTGIDTGSLSVAPRGTPLWRNRQRGFAPRLGAAIRLSRDGRWIARLGAGLHYSLAADGLFPSVASQPALAGIHRTFFGVSRSDDPGRFSLPADLTPQPPFFSFGAYHPAFRTPRSWQGSATVERALRSAAIAASWTGSAGRNLMRRESIEGSFDSAFPLLDVFTSFGRSSYHALQIQLRQRLAFGLEALASWAWSHSIDNGSFNTETLLPTGRRIDRGSSSFDARHLANFSFSWDPPLPGRFPRALQGWGFDGIVRARTGFPINLTVEGDEVLPSPLGPYRPSYDARQPLWRADANSPAGRVLNHGAFAWQPSHPLEQGNLGRNAIAGLGFAQIDLAVRRDFGIGPARLQLRVEAFNATNHPNFGNPVGALGRPDFGRFHAMLNATLGREASAGQQRGGPISGLTRILQIGGPRMVQGQLRLQF